MSRFQAAWPARAGRHRRAGPPGPARRRHRAVPPGRRRRPRAARPRIPGCGPSSRPSPTPRPPPAPGAARPGGRRPDGAGQPPPGGAGPRGHPRQRPAVLVLRARARAPTRRWPTRGRPAPGPRRSSTGASRPAIQAQLAAGFVDEVRDAGRPARGSVPHRRPGPRLPRAARPPRRGGSTSTRRSTLAVRRTRASPAARSGGSGAIPRIAWVDAGHNALAVTLARLGD